MRLKRFGFLRHYRKIKLQGLNLSSVINRCIINEIELKDLKWKDALESTVKVKGEDFDRLTKLAGYSYKITVLGEGGILPLFKTVKDNILTVTGAFLLGALIFYQSLFVAEIRVDGYISLTEAEIRETLAAAGLYEGVRIEEDYSGVKAALYENHEEITWVNIFADGRLIKVNIAEAGNQQEEIPDENTPVNIVAQRSAIIESVLPLQGNAKVEKGDYVNKGEVLISGEYEYQSSDYSRGEGPFVMYSHAKGAAMAKAPRMLTYYFEKKERTKEFTGKTAWGIYLKIGDMKIDTAGRLKPFETCVRKETMLLNTVKPLPLSLGVVKLNEVKLAEKPQDMNKVEEVLNAAIRQYAREEFKQGEEIVTQSIDYSEGVNVIKAEVFLEVLEDIGEEKEIKFKDKEKNKEEISAE